MSSGMVDASGVPFPQSATRELRLVLVNPGSEPGGTQVYLQGLVVGLRARGIEVVEVGSVRQLARSFGGSRRTVVNVVGCLPSPVVFAAFALARARRLPTVWTPIFHPSRPHTYGRSVPHVAMRVFDRVAPRMARFADAVIALTEEEQTYFQELVGTAVDLLPCGPGTVTATLSARAVADFRERHGLDPGPIILVLGRSSPRHKGLAFCLEVFGSLRRAVPDAQLVFVGGLGAGTEMEGVHVLGWVSDDDRDAALSAATVVFVPSAYEALSIAVIEAWAVGVPVVASDRVALAPLVARASAGWVVPFNSPAVSARALETALSDSEAREFAVARGKALVKERFQNDDFVDKTLGVYQRLMASRGAG
jgi:glycosyltransferase involved in cell wall biosynthesis